MRSESFNIPAVCTLGSRLPMTLLGRVLGLLWPGDFAKLFGAKLIRGPGLAVGVRDRNPPREMPRPPREGIKGSVSGASHHLGPTEKLPSEEPREKSEPRDGRGRSGKSRVPMFCREGAEGRPNLALSCCTSGEGVTPRDC